MAWTDSRVFQYTAKNVLGVFMQSNVAPTGMSATGLLGDSVKFALYGVITPDKTVATAALCSFNGAASQWVTGNEATGGSGYTSGGFVVPATKAWATDATAGPCFTSSGSTTWTIVGGPFSANGGLFYDDSITVAGNFGAKQGICYNYFGGAQSVTGGTFTIAWATAGSTANTIFNIST